MKITTEISDKRVTDLLHGHGGSYSPWLKELSGKWNKGRGMLVVFDRELDDEGTFKGRLRLGRRSVARGLALMAQNDPQHFADFLQENDDDITFDTALQYIVFAKTVFG